MSSLFNKKWLIPLVIFIVVFITVSLLGDSLRNIKFEGNFPWYSDSKKHAFNERLNSLEQAVPRCHPHLITEKKQEKRFHSNLEVENLDFSTELNQLNEQLKQLNPNDFVDFLSGKLDANKLVGNDVYPKCIRALNKVDKAINKELDYRPYDSISTHFFETLKFCETLILPLRAKQWANLKKNPDLQAFIVWQSQGLSGLIDWPSTVQIRQHLQDNFCFATAEDYAQYAVDNYWYPSLFSIAVSDSAPLWVLEALLKAGENIRNIDYELALLAKNEAFFKLIKQTKNNMNVTIRQKSLYEIAASANFDAVRVFNFLHELGVDPNLNHGSGKNDLVYRLLMENRKAEAQTLIEIGAFVDQSHKELASQEMSEIIQTHKCLN